MAAAATVKSSLNVLLVEDNPGDVELTCETLQDCKLMVNLAVVDNGLAAMNYLKAEEPFEQRDMPDLILLDLNLPGRDGREVIKEVKSDAELRRIPIVVLTTSEAEQDIVQSYDLGANCYLNKPVGLEEFAKLVQTIEGFWFTVVKLPD